MMKEQTPQNVCVAHILVTATFSISHLQLQLSLVLNLVENTFLNKDD